MGNGCLHRQRPAPEATLNKYIEEEAPSLPSLPQQIRRGKHSTSLQLIVKDRLARWEYVEWGCNTLRMIEKDFYYDSKLKRTRGGYANNHDMKPIWAKVNKSLKIHGWKGIKSFKLSITGYQAMGAPGLTDLAKGISQDLPELHYLKLNASYSSISDQGLDDLGLFISRDLRSLRSLRVHFKCDGTGLKRMISHVGRHVYDLSDLYIEFPNSIQDENAKAIISATVKHLVKLTSLSLEFSYCENISDLGLSEIGSELIRHKRDIRSLILCLCNIRKVLNEGLESLVYKVCQGFKNLKDLTLDFSYYEQLNNGSIQSILSDVPCLNGLERLQLNFRGCETITDDCVKALASKIIPSLVKLRELKLNFAQNKELTDSAIECLILINYKKLPHLENIDFNFYFCTKITSQGVQALSAYLKNNLENFKSFRLHLYQDSTIHQEVNALKQKFRFSSNFELIETH